MYQRLLELEKCFFDVRFISDEAWLDGVLHDDFLECGKSGTFARKADTVEALLAWGSDRDIEIRDFSCERLDQRCWMVHYVTGSEEEMYYRTSIWVGMADSLQLRFHQASKLAENAENAEHMESTANGLIFEKNQGLLRGGLSRT